MGRETVPGPRTADGCFDGSNPQILPLDFSGTKARGKPLASRICYFSLIIQAAASRQALFVPKNPHKSFI